MSKDADPQTAVLAELGWETSIDSARIGVTARDGVATLSGHVRGFGDKRAAEHAASRVKGVKAIAEELVVRLPHDIKRDDTDIAEAAVDRLEWDASAPRDCVKARVEKGWVTRDGHVDWRYQKAAAAECVRGLLGVINVSNPIEIKPTVSASNVGGDITRAPRRSWCHDPNRIKVTESGGKIKLTGDVTTWNGRELAGATAWSAPGVTAVENDMSVKS